MASVTDFYPPGYLDALAKPLMIGQFFMLRSSSDFNALPRYLGALLTPPYGTLYVHGYLLTIQPVCMALESRKLCIIIGPSRTTLST